MAPTPRTLCMTVLLALAGFALWIPAQAEALGPNLLANDGFEVASRFEAWRWGATDPTRATVTLDESVAHSGQRSARFHSDLPHAPNVYGGLSQVVRGITPGSQYLIRLWAKGTKVGIVWFGGGPEWKARKGLPTGTFDWTPVELRWTAPEEPTDFELRINVDSETEALWVDDVSFQEVNPLGLEPRLKALTPGEALRRGYLLIAPVERAPRIDGDLSDWPAEATATRIPQDAGLVMIDRKDDSDLSATLRTAADARNLYLGITVRDDVHWAPPEALAWTIDGLQVSFDPRHERTPGGYGPHDSEYSLVLDNDGKPRVQCWQPAQALGDQSKAIALAVKRTDTETIYEAAVPWTAIGVPTGAGTPVLGLNVLINDNDGSGRRGYIELTSGIGKVKDPSAYVTALVSGSRSLAVLPAKPVAYTDEFVDLKAVAVLGAPLTQQATVEFAALDAKGKQTILTTASLPVGTGGIVQLSSHMPPGTAPATTTQVQARLLDSAGRQVAVGKAALQVSGLKTQLAKEAARLKERTDQVEQLARQVEAKGLATDYERVTLAVAQDFVGYALDDLAHGRPERSQHVVAVLDQSLKDTERTLQAYLSGTAKPLLVPRFVTSKVDVRDGAFWADTVIPTTGRHERRPVFFTGYGHFSSVVRDLPKFTDLGVNIIQIERGPNSTLPAEGVVTDEPMRDFVGKALDLAEKNNVMICWLASPHYFPGWALTKWPDLQKGGGGFFRVAVDAPQARQVFRTHLETSLNAIKQSPALHSVCLSNEPVYTDWQNDPFRRAEFTDYLRGKFGTIDKLNAAWGTNYADFASVPILPTNGLPREADMTPLRYEMARFNMLEFSEYHKFMAEVVHATRPGTPAHAKVMCVPSNRQNLAWGCDPEQFAWMGDLNGNDCWNMFSGFGDQYAANWMAQNVYYDLQRSMREVPVINTEDHIIVDREQRLIPPQHTDFALWQGAIHGRGASMIWVWERTYDRTHDFEGSILHRPENVVAVGRVGLDLQRLAPEVVKLQRARTPVAMLYSMTAQLWSDTAYGTMMKAYEALNACGVPVRFVSEQQAAAGRLKAFRAVIAPAVKHAPDSLAAAIAAYCLGGGKLWVIGEEPVCGRDEYSRPRALHLPETAVVQFPGDLSARELWARFLQQMQAEGLRRPLTVTDAGGRAPWAVEYRAARDAQGTLVSIVNLWGTPQKVRLSVDGQAVRGLQDLRRDTEIQGNELTLQPLEATILRVK